MNPESFCKDEFARDAAEKIRLERLKRIRGALPKKYNDINELIKEERYDEAESLCKERISLNARDYVAITQLGEICWEKRQKKKAIKLFKQAIRLSPDYPFAHFLLGRAYVLTNKYKKGVAEFNIFREKMDLLPEKMSENTIDYYVSALHYIGYIYSTRKEYDKAAEECRKIIELKPDDHRAHFNLAVCYYRQKSDRQRAYNELQKVIETSPNSYWSARAEFFIDFMRRNPDSRIIEDFTFIDEEE